MKLLNPTNEELDLAFATNIAGWTSRMEGCALCWYNAEGKFVGGRNDGQRFSGIPKFTQSADLVLPWLEKRYIETEIKSWWDSPAQHFNESTRQGHRVFEPNGVWTVRVPGNNAMAEDKSFARAAVIALLRANGIEVEFSHAN